MLYLVGFSSQAQNAQSMKLIWRPVDLILVLLLLAAMAFTTLRGLVSANRVTLNQHGAVLKSCRHVLKTADGRFCPSSSASLSLPLSHPVFLLFCPPSVGGSGLSAGSLFRLPEALRALPEGSRGLPQGDGERCLFAHIQPHDGPLLSWKPQPARPRPSPYLLQLF